jgi:hypothetical protein
MLFQPSLKAVVLGLMALLMPIQTLLVAVPPERLLAKGEAAAPPPVVQQVPAPTGAPIADPLAFWQVAWGQAMPIAALDMAPAGAGGAFDLTYVVSSEHDISTTARYTESLRSGIGAPVTRTLHVQGAPATGAAAPAGAADADPPYVDASLTFQRHVSAGQFVGPTGRHSYVAGLTWQLDYVAEYHEEGCPSCVDLSQDTLQGMVIVAPFATLAEAEQFALAIEAGLEQTTDQCGANGIFAGIWDGLARLPIFACSTDPVPTDPCQECVKQALVDGLCPLFTHEGAPDGVDALDYLLTCFSERIQEFLDLRRGVPDFTDFLKDCVKDLLVDLALDMAWAFMDLSARIQLCQNRGSCPPGPSAVPTEVAPGSVEASGRLVPAAAPATGPVTTTLASLITSGWGVQPEPQPRGIALVQQVLAEAQEKFESAGFEVGPAHHLGPRSEEFAALNTTIASEVSGGDPARTQARLVAPNGQTVPGAVAGTFERHVTYPFFSLQSATGPIFELARQRMLSAEVPNLEMGLSVGTLTGPTGLSNPVVAYDLKLTGASFPGGALRLGGVLLGYASLADASDEAAQLAAVLASIVRGDTWSDVPPAANSALAAAVLMAGIMPASTSSPADIGCYRVFVNTLLNFLFKVLFDVAFECIGWWQQVGGMAWMPYSGLVVVTCVLVKVYSEKLLQMLGKMVDDWREARECAGQCSRFVGLPVPAPQWGSLSYRGAGPVGSPALARRGVPLPVPPGTAGRAAWAW